MTMESDLTTLLKAVTPQVFPDVAPSGTVAPYATYQAIGGQALRWVEGTPADKRHTLMQINVWASTRAAALVLMRQVEEAMCVGAPWAARPSSEAANAVDEDLTAYGCTQDFDIWSPR